MMLPMSSYIRDDPSDDRRRVAIVTTTEIHTGSPIL